MTSRALKTSPAAARKLVKLKGPQPMAHQAVSLKHDEATPVVFDTSDPGTGKTFVRVLGFAKRRRAGGGCALVLAPRSLLNTVWAADFFKFAPDMKVSVATAANRAKAFTEDADVYVTNIDGVKWVAKQKKPFMARFTELIIDESSNYKHHTTQRSKAVAKVAKFFERRSCLTGTPNGTTICDVWHQVHLLDQGQRLGSSFYSFRNSVCAPVQVGRHVQAVQWQDKDGAEEAVFGLLQDIVIRHKFEDCVDIPANHTYSVPYELTDKQRKTYEQMEDSQIAFVMNGGKGKAPIEQITAINAAAALTKLLQISSGAVYRNPEKYTVIDTARYEMVMDLAGEAKHSLVFFFWKHQRDLLLAEAEKRKLKFSVLDGGTSDSERENQVKAYQAGWYDVMFAHPKSAAHGLTLTKGTRTIWPCPTYDLELFKQGSKRQHRVGQTQKTETIIVCAKDTVEQKVYDNLLAKDARMSNLLELFASLKSNI